MAKKLTIIELQKMTWASREAMEKDFKRAGVPLVGADYATGVDGYGKWQIVDRTDWPVESTANRDEFIVKPGKGYDAGKVTNDKSGAAPKDDPIPPLEWPDAKAANDKPAKVPAAAKKVPPAPAKKEAAAPAKKEAAAPAKKAVPAKKGAAAANGSEPKGGPDTSKLPADFDDWAIKTAMSKDGLMRVDLQKKAGQTVKWFPYLKQIAGKRSLQATMERDGRYTRFRMTKANKAA